MGMLIGALLGYFIFRTFFGILLGGFLGMLFLFPPGRRKTFSFFASYTQQVRELQKLYFFTFFTLLGKMAKADGNISKQEGDYLISLIHKMQLNPEQKTDALNYFNNAKNEPKTVAELAQQFHLISQRSPQIERQMMYQLIGMAAVDGIISSQEEAIIHEVARIFGIPQTEIDHILSSFTASSEKSYHILGVDKQSSDADIKHAYKTLIKECHPDVLRSKGLPPAMQKTAQQRFYDIQNAWNSIKKERAIS